MDHRLHAAKDRTDLLGREDVRRRRCLVNGLDLGALEPLVEQHLALVGGERDLAEMAVRILEQHEGPFPGHRILLGRAGRAADTQRARRCMDLHAVAKHVRRLAGDEFEGTLGEINEEAVSCSIRVVPDRLRDFEFGIG